MLAGSISEQYRCLVEILTCFVCKGLVSQAHICPNCSKFYCLECINRQLVIEQKCLNCNQFLSEAMLSNCEKLCEDLTETLQKVKLRGLETTRISQDKSPYYCYHHKLEKTYYCQTCDRPLCSDCSVLTDTHRGHTFIKLSIIKSSYEERMGRKLDQIKTFKQNIQKKIQLLCGSKQSKEVSTTDGLGKLQSSMKSLRDNLKKNLKKLLNEGEKKLTHFNQTVQFWNERYQTWMKILKNTSKGKFIQHEHDMMEKGLINLFQQIKDVEVGIVQQKDKISKRNFNVNYIHPEFYSYTFIVQKFSQKKKSNQFFYTDSVVTKEGLQLRLKIYPKGIRATNQQDIKNQIKMIKKQSKNQDYFGIFIELVNGPVTNTKLKHQIILINHHNEEKQFKRQFQSEFDLGLCWGYENYIKLNQLYQEGYYNRDFDFIEITLKIGPCSYYQATKDQSAFIKAKQKAVLVKQRRIQQLSKYVQEKQAVSTSSDIDIAILNVEG